MAVNILTANLNTYGNNGHFETDRSSWGFGDQFDKTITRSAFRRKLGLCSALVQHVGASTINQGTGVFCKVPVPVGSVGKKFLIRAWVLHRTSAPFADDAEVIGINQVDTAYYTWDPALSVTKTILEATDDGVTPAWVEVSGVVEIIQDFFLERHVFQVEVSGDHNPNGLLYIDEFAVFEVEVTDDPGPTCTIDLDEDNTVVTDESTAGAGDGSIEGAVASGAGPFEWSINGPFFSGWQSSNLFAGLSPGTYTLYVRESLDPTCQDSHVFSVNASAIVFNFEIDITNESIAGASDGGAVLTPSGAGAPFTYSKDGGASFQAGNSFLNLPPGEYAFVVKDSSGNSLVKYATIAAGDILFEKAYFSKNPIPFSVNAQAGYEALTNYRIYCDTRVEEVSGSGVFTSKLAQDLPADSDGKAVFNLRPAFRDQVNAIVPGEPTSAIVKLTDRLKWYKNYVGHLQNTEVIPGVLTPTSPFIVLLGGISKYHYPTIEFLTTYLQANKKFLTWAPVVKDVTRQQEDYLNFFVYSPTITGLKLRIKAYFDDATNETTIHSTISCVYGELYQIPAGTSNTSVLTINPAKNPVRYEISLLNQADSLISEVRTYNIDRVTHPRTRYLMILNSLGAFEVHRFTGTTRAEEQYTRDLVQKFLPHDYDQLDGELEVNDVQGQRNYSLSSGYLKGKYADAWLDYMRDLLRSKRFYDVTGGQRMPMVISNTSIALKEDQNFRKFVRIEAREVYMNENYTPDEV